MSARYLMVSHLLSPLVCFSLSFTAWFRTYSNSLLAGLPTFTLFSIQPHYLVNLPETPVLPCQCHAWIPLPYTQSSQSLELDSQSCPHNLVLLIFPVLAFTPSFLETFDLAIPWTCSFMLGSVRGDGNTAWTLSHGACPHGISSLMVKPKWDNNKAVGVGVRWVVVTRRVLGRGNSMYKGQESRGSIRTEGHPLVL